MVKPRCILWLITVRSGIEARCRGCAAVDAVDKKGNTPLIAAARGGHLEVVRLLLKNGATPGHANQAGRTALQLARRTNNPGWLEALETEDPMRGPGL